MLTSLNRLTGLPVRFKDREMGYVERAVADWRQMRLFGLVVRKGFGNARWSPADSIARAGRHSVEVSQCPVRMPETMREASRLAVFAPDGYAGRICDALLYSDTLRIAALEISRGPLYRLLGYCAYATQYQQRTDGELLVPKLLSWAQIRTQLGEGGVP